MNSPIQTSSPLRMKVHLSTVESGELLALLRAAAAHSSTHTLVDDPAAADLILLAGSFGSEPERLLAHPLYRAHPDRCAVYTEDDNYLPLAPGVYCSAQVDSSSRAGRTFSSAYASAKGQYSNPFVAGQVDSHKPSDPGSRQPAPIAEKRLLFSFLGGSTSLLRKRLFNLNYNRPDVAIENTSTYYHWDLSQPGRAEQQQHYAQTLASSHFVLCPRGAGTGSIRLFEVMSAGIAPVLLSDSYLLPAHVDWDQFLLRFPESDLERLPELIEPHRSTSAERGRLAQEAWQQHFSPAVLFDGIVRDCAAALAHGAPAESVFRQQQRSLIARAKLRRQLRSFARTAVLRTLKILHLKSPYQMNR